MKKYSLSETLSNGAAEHPTVEACYMSEGEVSPYAS